MFNEYSEDGPNLLTGDDGKIRGHFVLKATTTVANTLRRSILMETRSVGFFADLTSVDPGIKIAKNTGPIFNEMLAHRLTLIPIGVRRLDEFDPSKYEFALKVSNTSTDVVHVTADQFQVREKGDDQLFHPLGPEVTAAMFPQDPITKQSCLITTLRPRWNQSLPPDEIDLVATAVKGRGRDFMGFSPVAQCSYQNTPDPDPSRQREFFNEWLASFKKIKDTSTVDPGTLANYEAEWKTMAIQRCFIPNSFSFTIESVGIRPVKEIVAEGIKAVIDLVSPYTDATLEGVTFLPLESRMGGLRVVFQDQEHTLGCLLEAMIHDIYLKIEGEGPISYAAYKVPHPLEKKMHIILGKHTASPDGVTEAVAREVIVAAAQKARGIFQEMATAWASV